MTNLVIQTIQSRRSVRKYKPQQVKESDLLCVLECGKYAPSGRNFKAWQFVAVQNKEMLERIRLGSNTSVLMPAWADSFYQAPTVIIAFADPALGEPIKDGNMALQNMMLAAQSLGLCSCYINVVKQLFSFTIGDEIKRDLGVPAHYIATGSITLGYGTETPQFDFKNMDCATIYK